NDDTVAADLIRTPVEHDQLAVEVVQRAEAEVAAAEQLGDRHHAAVTTDTWVILPRPDDRGTGGEDGTWDRPAGRRSETPQAQARKQRNRDSQAQETLVTCPTTHKAAPVQDGNSSTDASGVAEPTDGQAPDQDRPADARRLDTGTDPLLMGNGKGGRSGVSWRDLRPLGDSCGHPKLPRGDADEALEVMGELTLVREAGVCGDVRQGQVAAALQELLGSFDAAEDDVLVWWQAGGRLELPREVVGAEAGDRGQLLQARAAAEVVLDVRDDGAEPSPRQRAVPPALRLAGRQDVPEQMD